MRLHHMIIGSGFAVAIAFVTPASYAAPITSGTLGMTGVYQAENAAGTNVSLSTANWIDFGTNLAAPTFDAGAPSTANTGNFLVTQATGSFTGLFGQTGLIHDLLFAPSTPIAQFFSVGGVTFNLASIAVTAQNNSVLGLTGAGTFQPGTADASSGTWSASFQTDGTNLIGAFTWSANSSPTGVPEPATLGLLGASLLGFVGLRRRRLNT